MLSASVLASHEGQPSADPSSALQIGASHSNGWLSVLCDTQLIETFAHFARERIPERFKHLLRSASFLQQPHSWLPIGAFRLKLPEPGENSKLHTLQVILPMPNSWTNLGGRQRCSFGSLPQQAASDTVRDVRGWATKCRCCERNPTPISRSLMISSRQTPEIISQFPETIFTK